MTLKAERTQTENPVEGPSVQWFMVSGDANGKTLKKAVFGLVEGTLLDEGRRAVCPGNELHALVLAACGAAP